VKPRVSIVERLYRASLALYPRAFRDRFADEMREFAHLRVRAARCKGSAALARETTSLLSDLTASIAKQWLIALRERRRTTTDYDTPTVDALPRDNMDIVIQDLRFALRALARRPGFTIVAALTLALGIGANTAIFSVVNAVLIRPLPYNNPDQVMLVWGTQGQQANQGVVYADYVDWRARNHTFTEMGAFRPQSVNLTGGDTPDRLIGSFVSASLFRVLNTKLSQGRLFTNAETEVATKAPVAILQYEAWRSRFGSRSDMLGKTIVVNGTTFTVVGITAPNTPIPLGAPDIYLPIGYYPNANGLDRGVRGILVAARLKPGISVAAAQRDLSNIAKQLEQEYPATNAGTGAQVISLKEQMVGGLRESLLIIVGAVAVVLLIACANVANLQLARGAARSRELSVRAALGAGRARIAQQLLTESVVLSIIGGVAGMAVAVGLTKALVTLIGPQLPIDATDIRLDVRVLLFALGISIATGILFGLAPAWQASRANLNDMLRSRMSGSLASVATRNSLVIIQLALSLALLASAGLLTRSLMALQRVDPGFDGSNLLTAQFRLPAGKYDSPEKIWAMFERTVAELRAIPGVESAALVRASPLSQNGESYSIEIEGKPAVKAGDAPQMLVNSVTPGYFSTMRIPVLLGHDIAPTDRMGSPGVIVVNKSFADATWPNQSPLGKRIKIGDEDWRTVIGVVGDTKHYTLNEKQLLQGYIPHAQRPQIFTSIVVRAKGNALDLAKPVREAIWRVDRDQPVWRFRAMEQDIDAVVTSKKTMMMLTGLFALVALLVAAVGIYGVLSYTMTQRTQEVGIRMALGAEVRDVRRMVLGEGVRLIVVAVFIGLVVSFGAARLLRNQLFGVAPLDALTFVAVTVILAGVAMLACYIPARRASRIDPMVALRSE
jgi:putative ABC transport system permease protein